MTRRGRSDDDGPDSNGREGVLKGAGGFARETDGRARGDGFRDVDVQRMTRFSSAFRATQSPRRDRTLFSNLRMFALVFQV